MKDAAHPWIQTMGQIAIHGAGRGVQALRGSTLMLLALLVAAGPKGASVEAIADAYWGDDRPSAWAVAMRVAASHLVGLLPDGWTVETADGTMRLVPSTHGWVDAWRLEDEFTNQSATPVAGVPRERPDWLEPGAPFAGIENIGLIDEAAGRLVAIIGEPLDSSTYECPLAGPLPLTAEGFEDLRSWVLDERRVLFVAAPEKLAVVSDIVLDDDDSDTHVIVGDRDLLLPLGPFAMTFPQLRDEFQLRQGEVEPDTATKAWRIVTDGLAARASLRTQRVLIANAHELDRVSLELASHLIERGPLRHFSIVLLGDASHSDIRWHDFMSRAVTAGCTIQHA